MAATANRSASLLTVGENIGAAYRSSGLADVQM